MKCKIKDLVAITPWYEIKTIGRRSKQNKKYLITGSVYTKPILVWSDHLEEVAKTAEIVEGSVFEVDSVGRCIARYYAGTDDEIYSVNCKFLRGTGVTEEDIDKAKDFAYLLDKWNLSATSFEELFSA